MSFAFDPAIALAGALVGLMVGLTGMGGGALLTPILVMFFGIDPLTAVSSDLVAAVVMKPVGGAVHLRRGTVNLGMVRWLVAGSIPTAFLSVVVLTRIADPDAIDEIVRQLVGAALLLASVALLLKGVFSGRRATVDATSVQIHPFLTLAIGVFGGAMVGLTSVGSGSLMMVLMLLVYPQLTSAQLIGTDLVQAVALVGSAAVAHLIFGDVQLGLTGSLLVGAIPAVWLGAHISSRAPDRFIRPILPVILIASGMKMLGVPTTATAGLAIGLIVLTALTRRGTATSGNGGAPSTPDKPGTP
jgi:uncharacterized membrane protein YfcA